LSIELLDLFSGIGGFSYAASQFGIETCGFAEIDPFCSKVLFKHWPDVINYGDVKNIHHHKHVDLITGGFPCQPFSIAGNKKGNKDERYIWPEFFRIIRESKPTWVIAENVPNIIDMELDNILDDLESEGYETRSFCIPACAIGAPHKRERLWIVANSNEKRCNDRINNRKKRQMEP
jgi:DNA (cytosine-5)-methyltransferase 1